MADGPTTWTTPVRSNRAGVYLVELPGAGASAPLDFNAVGRWLERVPGLLLDGARPTGRELAARLQGYWLADQSVLYIGTSGASIGSRIGAFHRTPLGDRKPYAGGYWLKTLAEVDRLRVWWAETDAPEEYEDALLEAFAAGVPADVAARLHDAAVVLPFANLKTAEGIRKQHGITGALLVDDDDRPATDAERRAAAGRRGAGGSTDPTRRTGVLRSRTALKNQASPSRAARASDGGPAPRRMSQAAREAAAGRAAKDPTRLSEAGLAALRAELDELTTVTRPAIVARIVAARELGDLKENSDYHEARREQSFAEGRIRAIEDLLRNVVLIEEGLEDGRSRLGSTVVVESPFGDEERYTLVGSTEASPASGRISTSSPIGAALLDRVAGDEVEVVVPSGRLRYRIVEVH
ncbi:MAG: transcription elongation factor GreA [Chloroflexota bacterium]|nr:transcription elongation factor GreA [Chloroflexota bacterium]